MRMWKLLWLARGTNTSNLSMRGEEPIELQAEFFSFPQIF